MKMRHGPDGLHLFDRDSGLNIVMDEVKLAPSSWATAPRQVSIALTNACDLNCSYCYAPKHRAKLKTDHVISWLDELDEFGCMGIGFGGGEPTLHPDFIQLCAYATKHTGLAVTFTTHGHHLSNRMLNALDGNVHFIRISVDGTGATYESLRGRRYEDLVARIQAAAAITAIGINVVVNNCTLSHLDAIVDLANSAGAAEILLLPQQETESYAAPDRTVHQRMAEWVRRYSGPIRLSVSEAGAQGLPYCEPLPLDIGLRAYAHIDASAKIRANSYASQGVPIGATGVLRAIETLHAQTGGAA